VQAAIANAQTLAEVERLETALKTGIVPSEVMVRLAERLLLTADGLFCGAQQRHRTIITANKCGLCMHAG
jgi:hypothetical protein